LLVRRFDCLIGIFLAYFPFLIDSYHGEETGTMEIDVRIQIFLVVSVQQIGTGLWDVNVAQIFTYYSAILSLYQSIIVGVPWSGFGETNQEFIQ
jgi:hypothetical protein